MGFAPLLPQTLHRTWLTETCDDMGSFLDGEKDVANNIRPHFLTTFTIYVQHILRYLEFGLPFVVAFFYLDPALESLRKVDMQMLLECCMA